MNRLNALHAAVREVGIPASTQLAACRDGPLRKPASIRLASREGQGAVRSLEQNYWKAARTIRFNQHGYIPHYEIY